MELVDRRAVVSRLLRATEPVVVVSAPAGCGKTVAVMQWASLETRPVAWLRLDDADNDPVLLLAYLAATVDRVVGLDPDVLQSLDRAEAPRRDVVLRAIVEALATARPFGLVLDDCHLVENRECWDALRAIVEELPEGATLVAVSRVEPPLPLGRLRAQGRLFELGVKDLALDRDETAEMLRLHGLEADENEAGALLELTEGWATGVYLGLLAGRDGPAGAWLDEVRGDQRAIAAYLLDEVLERQPPDLQAFLEQTSIIDELTAPLCAAVAGRDDAGAVLVGLARDNLFVSALDDHDERFRYHHLFAELLQSLLERRGEGEAMRLHRLAAVWYEANGQAEPAIRHYLAAGDVEATVDLAALTADTLLVQGYVESARRLLKIFTEAQLLAHPALAIAGGWVFALAAGTPEEQHRWARHMTTLEFEDGPSPIGAASLRSSHLIIMAELAPEGLSQARRAFEEVWRLEEHRPGEWRDVAKGGLARTHYLSGSAERAAAMYSESLRERTCSGGYLDADIAGDHAWLALIAEDAGRWDEAEEHMVEAERMCPRMGLDETTHHSGWLDMLLAHVRLMSHKDDRETMGFAHTVDDFTAEMVHNAPWVLLFRDVVLGEVALEQGDLAAARGWCDRALRTFAGWRDAGMFGRRARQLADALERRAFAEPLTPAERRVLELLPSHLPIVQIAARLHLSRNTVKTHLRDIYRKLEVDSRADAVERARSLGLLRS